MGQDRLAVARVDRGALWQTRDPGEVGALGGETVLDLLDADPGGEERRRDQNGEHARGREQCGDQ